jgi:putative salt-induced outer membrane protein YdiY
MKTPYMRQDTKHRLFTGLVALAGLLSTLPTRSLAQDDDRKLGWTFTGELSGVQASGNQQTFSLGADALLQHLWTRSGLTFEAGMIRTQSTTVARTATGTGQDDFTVTESKTTESTAEAYHARGLYNYDVSDRFFFLGGVDWLRNTFSGIDSRFLLGLGAGNTWTDTEKVVFKTAYSFTYTFQEDVVTNPILNNKFPGLQLAYSLKVHFTKSTSFESALVADWNLDNTDDIRLDWKNALPVSISDKLALKPSLRLLWRNDPALEELPLEGSDETVRVPLDKLDSFFTLAIVVTL